MWTQNPAQESGAWLVDLCIFLIQTKVCESEDPGVFGVQALMVGISDAWCTMWTRSLIAGT